MNSLSARGIATVLAVLAAGVGLWAAASQLAASAAFSHPQISALWSWSLHSWTQTRPDADGLMVRTVYEPVALARNIALILLAAFGMALAAVRIFALGRPSAACAGKTASEVEAIGGLLAEELRALAGLFQSHSRQNEAFSAALASGRSLLGPGAGAEQVRSVIHALAAASKEMLRGNEDIEKKLSDSRAQIETLRAALAESQEVAARDSLTQAYTRRYFDQSLTDAARKARESRKPLSLVMADIDHFKGVNDRFGHPVGDDVLRKVSELLIANTKGKDSVARYGGEEFAIILPETPAEVAASLAEQIRRKLEEKRWTVNGGAAIGRVTASFGVAELDVDESPDELIRRADGKLYQSKAAGRNRVSR